jgi:hypothetical protein
MEVPAQPVEAQEKAMSVEERIEQVKEVYKKGRDVAQDFDTVINLLKNYVSINKDEQDDLFAYRFF